MAKKRIKSQSEKLAEMSDAELLETYFRNGGEIMKGGFKQPLAISHETMTCCSALDSLLGSYGGRKILRELRTKFQKGEVDRYGNNKLR